MQKKKSRQYPPIFEKLIPIALIAILAIFAVILIFTISVATGIVNGT